MGSSAGRRDKAYLAAKRHFQTTRPPCWLNGPTCTGIGLTPDHDPPLSTVADFRAWRGEYRPACSACQSRQGANIANRRRRMPKWTL